MVKVQGQNLIRNMVKQTAENGQKTSGDEDAASIASLAGHFICLLPQTVRAQLVALFLLLISLSLLTNG